MDEQLRQSLWQLAERRCDVWHPELSGDERRARVQELFDALVRRCQ